MSKNVFANVLKRTWKPFASPKAVALLCILVMWVMGAKAQQTPYVIWCEDNGTLYFTNSTKTNAQGGTYDGQTITGVWSGDAVTNSEDQPDWSYTVNEEGCTSLVFDESFKSVKPKCLSKWFFRYKNLTSITGIENLNTSETTNMTSMFFLCESLTTLDLRTFDVSKVEKAPAMFYGCKELKTIY